MSTNNASIGPQLRAGQFAGGGSGDGPDQTINLFRGDVNLSLTLLKLPGLNNLEVNIAAYYSAALGLATSTRNLEAPTSVLGLGWGLAFDQIQFQGSGTASYLEGSFVACINGRESTLVPLTWTNRGTSAEQLTFAARDANPLWQFTYWPAAEKWVVLRDDGVRLTFGDAGNAAANGVQWGVRWDNWAGDSSAGAGAVTTAAPQRYGRAWNCVQSEDHWGNAIRYCYQVEEGSVTGDLSYTRACYLAGITDAFGRTAALTYAAKTSDEYQPPNTVAGAAPAGGRQDCYESLYLTGITVCAPTGEPYGEVALDYDLLGSATLTKRVLTGVRRLRAGKPLEPSTLYTLDRDAGSPSFGRVLAATDAQGGVTRWTYAQQALGASAVFNLSYTAARPSGWDASLALPFFGDDYCMIAWYSSTQQQIQVQVLQYGGCWSQSPFEVTLQQVNPAHPGDIRIAFGRDFFALFIPNQATTNARFLICEQTANQFGRWTAHDYGAVPCTASLVAETALVAGDDFCALHPGGSQWVYRFVRDQKGLTWSPAAGVTLGSTSPPGALQGANAETRVALAGSGNRLAIGWFQTSGTAVHARDEVWWLDPTASAGPTWQKLKPSSDGNVISTFTWEPAYVGNYFNVGAGWVVSTAPGTAGRALLHILRWTRNFAACYAETKDGDTLVKDGAGNSVAPPTGTSDHLIVNGGQLYRFDGTTWQARAFTTWANHQIAVGDDCVIASSVSDTQAVRFNPVTGKFVVTSLSPGGLTSASPPARFAGRYVTIGTSLYAADTDGTWQSCQNGLAGADQSSIACRGDAFTVFETNTTADVRDTHVLLPANGQTGTAPVVLSGQRIANLGQGNGSLAGSSAFATFASGYADFTKVPSFTLHRVLNRQLDGYLTDVVVTRLTHDTGLDQQVQVYQYDRSSALFDAGGTVAQYPAVTVEHQDGQGTGLGKTVYQFLNGLPPASATDPLDHCYGQGAGMMLGQLEYDSTGLLVATRIHHWVGVTLATAAAGGFTPLAGVVQCLPSAQDATLENLPVVDIDGHQPTGATGRRSATLSYTYCPATAQVRSRALALFDDDGTARVRTELRTYAWELYPAIGRPSDGSAPRFSAEARRTLLNTGQAVMAQVTHYANDWGTAAVWEAAGQWVWRGDAPDATPTTGEPAFDFDDLAGNAAQWICHGRIGARTSTGQPCVGFDALGNPGVRRYDAAGLRPVASFQGSDGTDVAYAGFEDYESDSGWQGGTLTDSDAHTGTRCLALAAGATLTHTALVTAAGQDGYRLSGFAKAADGVGPVTVNLSLGFGGATAVSVGVDVGGDWQYVQLVAAVAADDADADADADDDNDNDNDNDNDSDSDQPGGQAIAAGFSASAGLLLDDLRIAPLVSTFQAQVYDPLWLPAAQVGANGATLRTFRDAALRPIATTGADDEIDQYQAEGFAPGGVDATQGRFNQGLELKATGAGRYDLFGGDWQSRWSPGGAACAWQLQGDALIHQGTGDDALTRNDPADLSHLAVAVQVVAGSGATAPTGDFGLALGDSRVCWNQAAGCWQLQDGTGTVLASGTDPSGGAPVLPCDLLVIWTARSVSLSVDHQLVLALAFPDDAEPLSGALSLGAAADGIGFRQVLTLAAPLAGIVFADGAGRPVQGQAQGDNAIVCMQRFYDGRGRQSVQTKPAPYAATPLGFRADFATAPDPAADWAMTGRVSDFYNGTGGQPDDGGYPYSRTRYEDSALNRVLELGQPGQELAIRSGNPYTTRLLYGTNAASPFFADGAAESIFGVLLHTDPDGVTTCQVTDGQRHPIATSAMDAPATT